MTKINETSIKSLEDLINDLIQNNKKKDQINGLFSLTPDEKKIFAYRYHIIMDDTSIIDIVSYIAAENPELTKLLSKFIYSNKMLKPYPNGTREYRQHKKNNGIYFCYGPKQLIREYNHHNWLEEFDEEAEFSSRFPSITSFIDKQGNKIVFDKERATQVKLAIIDQNIFPAKCIVEGAYGPTVQGTFKQYTKHIKEKGVMTHGKQ